MEEWKVLLLMQKKYYDMRKAAPTFILEKEDGLLACIVSSARGRLDLENMKKEFRYSKLKIAEGRFFPFRQ